jgi:hypothetical protein
VPRGEPYKGAVHNAEGVRVVGGQLTKEPSTPQRAVARYLGSGVGLAEAQQPALFTTPPTGELVKNNWQFPKLGVTTFGSDDGSTPNTPTPATNCIGQSRMDVYSLSSSSSLPNSAPIFAKSFSSSKENLMVFPQGQVSGVSGTSIDSNDSSSTVASESWKEYGAQNLSPKSAADSVASFEDGFDNETLLPKPETPPSAPCGLRCVGAFNFGPKFDPSDLTLSVARAQYPLENVTHAGSADGFAAFDLFYVSGTWPWPGMRHVRPNGNASYASLPSAHSRSGSDGSNESDTIDIDIDDADRKFPRGTLRLVNSYVSDSDHKITEVPSNLWNVMMGDEIAVVPADGEAREQVIEVRKPIETPSEDSEGLRLRALRGWQQPGNPHRQEAQAQRLCGPALSYSGNHRVLRCSPSRCHR